jgi:thiamine-monophosphate kinase
MPASPPRGRPVDERSFHAWLARHLPAARTGLLPIGDDAAALRPPPGAVAVLTTDALIEGHHFRAASPPESVGSAAVAVSLSDLAAKGARPAAVLLALVLPPGSAADWPARVVRAAERTAARYGAHVVGGDTKPGPARAVVGFALGWGRSDRLAPRHAARPGDVLVTTGVVGRGGVAAARLGRAAHPDARVLARLLELRPRVAEGRVLARWAHAMLDTSDGLAESARLLAAASQRRILVDEEALPYATGVRGAGRSPGARRARAFYGGDYELLAALDPTDLGRARRAVRAVGGRLTAIGQVVPGRGAWIGHGDHWVPMPAPGWRPFSTHRRLPR